MTKGVSPWCNCTGCLGVKHQFTYLLACFQESAKKSDIEEVAMTHSASFTSQLLPLISVATFHQDVATNFHGNLSASCCHCFPWQHFIHSLPLISTATFYQVVAVDFHGNFSASPQAFSCQHLQTFCHQIRQSQCVLQNAQCVISLGWTKTCLNCFSATMWTCETERQIFWRLACASWLFSVSLLSGSDAASVVCCCFWVWERNACLWVWPPAISICLDSCKAKITLFVFHGKAVKTLDLG